MNRSNVFAMVVSASAMALSGCALEAGSNGGSGAEGSVSQVQEPLGGLILGKYLALNGANGPLGQPVPPEDEQTTAFNTGRYNLFQNGRILWKFGAPEAFSTYGVMDGAYGSFGWEWGNLGFPTRDQYKRGSRQEVEFEFGRLFWTSTAGVWPVLIATNSGNRLSTQGWPTVSGSLPFDGNNGTCLTNAFGTGFSPGSTVSFFMNHPDVSALLGGFPSFTVKANGTFSGVTQTAFHRSCIDGTAIKKINNLITIEARDSTGRRAVVAISSSAGGNYTGAF